jgi:tetratricopeptide (TPR) repeat protein
MRHQFQPSEIPILHQFLETALKEGAQLVSNLSPVQVTPYWWADDEFGIIWRASKEKAQYLSYADIYGVAGYLFKYARTAKERQDLKDLVRQNAGNFKTKHAAFGLGVAYSLNMTVGNYEEALAYAKALGNVSLMAEVLSRRDLRDKAQYLAEEYYKHEKTLPAMADKNFTPYLSIDVALSSGTDRRADIELGLNAARIWFFTGDIDESRKILTHIQNATCYHPVIRMEAAYLLAQVEAAAGNIVQAMDLYKQVLEKSPQRADSLLKEMKVLRDYPIANFIGSPWFGMQYIKKPKNKNEVPLLLEKGAPSLEQAIRQTVELLAKDGDKLSETEKEAQVEKLSASYDRFELKRQLCLGEYYRKQGKTEHEVVDLLINKIFRQNHHDAVMGLFDQNWGLGLFDAAFKVDPIAAAKIADKNIPSIFAIDRPNLGFNPGASYAYLPHIGYEIAKHKLTKHYPVLFQYIAGPLLEINPWTDRFGGVDKNEFFIIQNLSKEIPLSAPEELRKPFENAIDKRITSLIFRIQKNWVGENPKILRLYSIAALEHHLDVGVSGVTLDYTKFPVEDLKLLRKYIKLPPEDEAATNFLKTRPAQFEWLPK